MDTAKGQQTNQENMNMDININEKENTQQKSEEQVQPSKKTIDTNKNVTINLGLLVNFKRIMDVCVSRGAFKSEELSQIGSIIDNLNLIIKENIVNL